MPLRLVQDSFAEPLSLAEAKLHLRVDVTTDDLLIESLITSVRMYAETITRRAFVAQAWKYIIDSFPGPTMVGIPWGKTFILPANAIILEKSQVQAVTAINYLDMSGVEQTFPAANYIVDYTSEPCRITPVFGMIWPIPMPQIGSAEVDFVAGYAVPFIANLAAGTIAVQGAWTPYAVGNVIRLSNSGGTLPAPLQPQTDYWIQSVVSPGVYTLAATNGGAAIALTAPGTGTSFIGVVPEGIKSWMKIRIGSLYIYREELVVLPRGKVEPIPFIDSLLDPYKVVF